MQNWENLGNKNLNPLNPRNPSSRLLPNNHQICIIASFSAQRCNELIFAIIIIFLNVVRSNLNELF